MNKLASWVRNAVACYLVCHAVGSYIQNQTHSALPKDVTDPTPAPTIDHLGASTETAAGASKPLSDVPSSVLAIESSGTHKELGLATATWTPEDQRSLRDYGAEVTAAVREQREAEAAAIRLAESGQGASFNVPSHPKREFGDGHAFDNLGYTLSDSHHK